MMTVCLAVNLAFVVLRGYWMATCEPEEVESNRNWFLFACGGSLCALFSCLIGEWRR